MNTTFVPPSEEEAIIKYVCGIDIGSQSCSGCVCQPNKQVIIKPSMFANTKDGWNVLLARLEQLEANPHQMVIGMEATARYHENLYHELAQRGYQLRLLHPGQTHHFHQQQGRLSQNRSARCHDHCASFAQWRRACGLHSRRTNRYLPRNGPFACPIE